MGTDLRLTWSSERSQAETAANQTQRLNAAVTHDLPVTAQVAQAGESYRTDSTTLVGSQQSGTIQYFVSTGLDLPAPPPQLAPYSLPQRAQARSPHLEPASTGEITLLPHAPSPPSLGFIDESGYYREWQEEDLCGRHASNTVRVALGKKPRTQEEYEKKVPGQRATRKDLVDFADEDGFDTKVYHIAQFGGASIDGIEDTKAFLIMEPGSSYHLVAMVRSEVKEGFHLSDSDDQNKREIYPGTANEALLEYQRRKNFTARAVITYHEPTSAHGRKSIAKNFYDKSLELYGRGSWKEGIEASNEVITRLWDEKKRSQRWLLAEALLDKAFALGKLDLPVESIALYDTVIERFRKAEEPELRMFAVKARRFKDFALSQ
jgi:hypothetical protein